jgi:formylglycine-generating enzyme required for sulfatase activity
MKRFIAIGAVWMFGICSSFAATPPAKQKEQPAPPPGMVLIPGGTFMMGCTEGDRECTDDEYPQHSVTLRQFYMDKTEVTNEAYQKCVEAKSCDEPEQAYRENCNWGKADRANHPVNCIFWNQAKSYCGWAGKRLPSEAEWEYAARSGHSNWKYPWGNEEPDCNKAVCHEGFKMIFGGGIKEGCGKGTAWLVGSMQENEFGLYDMAGNVSEWVDDCWNYSYVGAPNDGTVWSKGMCGHKVYKGGNWYEGSHFLSPSYRFWSTRFDKSSTIGFRCAKSIQ